MNIKKVGIGLLVAGGLATGVIGVQTSGKICGYSESNMWDKVNAYNYEKSAELVDEGCKNTDSTMLSVGNFCTKMIIKCRK